MSGPSFIDLIQENKEEEVASLLRRIVNAGGAVREIKDSLKTDIDKVYGKTKSQEHADLVDKFKFSIPRAGLDDWLSQVKGKGADPINGVHYKTEFGVSYANVEETSWTADPDTEGWREVDRLREATMKEPADKQPTEEQYKVLYNDTMAEVRRRNRLAKKKNPE